jgi:cystinosin
MPVLTLFEASMQASLFWSSLSRLIGWSYVILWTVSFYPQAILIWQRKSVAGVSLDFLALNVFGFFCYAIFNVAFLISSKIQQQYRNTHDGDENLVRWNDAAFAIHAFLIAAWQFGSTFVFKRAPGQKVATWTKLVLGALIVLFSLALALCIFGGGDDDSIIRWIDFINICSYIKLFITLIKYAVSHADRFA